jgi:4-hydroxybenzoyl-CoA thioesterase
MIFTTRKRIRFHHCDPAGIVFYPQFYVLLHEAQEDFLRTIGYPEHELISAGHGVPIVRMETDFTAPSRFGDEVEIDLTLPRLGASSMQMRYHVHASGDTGSTRLRALGTVVFLDIKAHKAVPWPAPLKAALKPYLESPT